MQRGQPADDAENRGRDCRDRLPVRRRRHHRPAAEAGKSTNTKIYASGPAAADFAKLNDYGLIVRVLDGPLTAASALKMSYAGITKGFTALGAAMMLAATRGGSAEALKAELAESRPDLLRYLSNQVPSMYSKAYRWVAELDEIAAFVGDEHAEHEMLAAAARLYERIADDFDEGKEGNRRTRPISQQVMTADPPILVERAPVIA